MKIVVAALKGGVGKTTTGIYLAALAARAGRASAQLREVREHRFELASSDGID